jgi:hypothetical protein
MIILVILLRAPNSLHQEATALGRRAPPCFLDNFLYLKHDTPQE